MPVLGDIIIIAGIIFMVFGVIGIFRFNNFFPRILVAAKIDTVGVLTILIGLMVKHGRDIFSVKSLLLLGIILFLNPLASHMLARSAYLSGYGIEDHYSDDEDDEDLDS